MLKILKILSFIIFLAVVLAIAMTIFRFCPPNGPWPMPPWCSYKEETGFEYKNPEYIQETFDRSDKNIELGIGTMDIWGNPHLFIDLGEDTEKHVEPTLRRIEETGSRIYLLTDFAVFQDNASILLPTEDDFPVNYNIAEDQMKMIVDTARENNQGKIMLFLNLADTKDEIEGFLESAKKEGSGIKEEIAGRIYKKLTAKGIGLSSKSVIKDYSAEQLDLLFANWQATIIKEAEKADNAGIDYIIINAGDIGLDYYKSPAELSQYYTSTAEKVKAVFRGKIGLYGDPKFLSKMDLSSIDFVVPFFETAGYESARESFGGVTENMTELENAWSDYFSRDAWKKLEASEKEIYLLVSIPSYDGAIAGGWIEPGKVYDIEPDFKEQALGYESLFRTLYSKDVKLTGVISYGYWWSPTLYPETKGLRNDLSHSIRNKDAENVFKKWTGLFE